MRKDGATHYGATSSLKQPFDEVASAILLTDFRSHHVYGPARLPWLGASCVYNHRIAIHTKAATPSSAFLHCRPPPG